MTPRTLRLLAGVYLVKTLILGAAWLMVPDLPQRAAAQVRQAWHWAVGDVQPAETQEAETLTR